MPITEYISSLVKKRKKEYISTQNKLNLMAARGHTLKNEVVVKLNMLSARIKNEKWKPYM